MSIKAARVSVDFSDRPDVIELLRVQAAHTGKSQKSIILEALEAYFLHHLENKLLLKAAEKTFTEWNNPDDEIYNKL
ncbi:MAG: hypothetical protein HY072_04285 [Deltaproteobacteria bacterium]|nr:hypothetical protein [Deltaproteobacteria bacterium]